MFRTADVYVCLCKFWIEAWKAEWKATFSFLLFLKTVCNLFILVCTTLQCTITLPLIFWKENNLRKLNSTTYLTLMFTGTCSRSVRRFYYDSQLKKCLPFTYNGCKGNQNRFLSLEECHKDCTNEHPHSIAQGFK